jgi:spore coat polysaccharide biosynthesis predicted glycosyltransferase SpsG/SAM-dependent methyltransferase
MSSSRISLPILVIPNQRPGQGGGHLARCSHLVKGLRALGAEAYLYGTSLQNIPTLSDSEAKQVSRWRFVVIDGFRTDSDFYKAWAKEAPVIGIDEGGPCRYFFDYLVDILPGPKRLSWPVRLLIMSVPLFRGFSFFKALCRVSGRTDRPNQANPDFLELPQKRREQFPAHINTILVSFGAEDAQGLSLPVLQGLLAHGSGFEISLAIGPKNRTIPEGARRELRQKGVRILEAPEDLAEQLYEYDLVITHYGLTAFEALAAQVPVALVSPSAYHEVLGLSVRFYSFGYGKGAARRAGHLLAHQSVQHALIQQSSDIYRRYGLFRTANDFAATLQSWTFPTGGRCPLCHDRSRRGAPVLARFPDRTYVRCGHCGITYMIRPNEPPITYDGAYFLEDYKKQYGKTYIEDFPNLVRMAQARLSHIQNILSRPTPSPEKKPVRLLDIGCAYGPFLAAAKDLGWSVMGLDPSQDAVRYVQDHVGVPVLQGLFPETDLTSLTGGEALQVVSLWYVIEHFPDLGRALEAASALLQKGGVLAFSTPSAAGISGRARLRSFLEHSPPDHWTILSPRTCGPLLARYGFRLVKTVSTGHHPERFPLFGPFAKSKKTFIYRVLLKVSQICSLGDTFEAYAVKE